MMQNCGKNEEQQLFPEKHQKDIVNEIVFKNDETNMKSFCRCIQENHVVLDFRYFKYMASPETYDSLCEFLISVVQTAIDQCGIFRVSINMKLLSIGDIDRHKGFIFRIIQQLKTRFPDKLDKCNIHNAPFIINQLIMLIGPLIDKRTQDKISLV